MTLRLCTFEDVVTLWPRASCAELRLFRVVLLKVWSLRKCSWDVTVEDILNYHLLTDLEVGVRYSGNVGCWGSVFGTWMLGSHLRLSGFSKVRYKCWLFKGDSCVVDYMLWYAYYALVGVDELCALQRVDDVFICWYVGFLEVDGEVLKESLPTSSFAILWNLMFCFSLGDETCF